jgi:hypothetical protein
MTEIKKGYLFIGLGKFYIEECYNLILTMQKHGDFKPKSILIYENDLEFVRSLKVFNHVIIFESKDSLFNECNNDFEKNCLYPRLNFKKYLIYDETIIVDSDVLCIYSTDILWNWLSNQSKDIVMLGFRNDPNWHWGQWGKICELNGFHMPHVHGGFFYFRKNSNMLKSFFEHATYAFLNFKKLHMLLQYKGGRVDEPCFAYAYAKINLEPVEFTEFPVMTLNLNSNHDIPSKLQTANGLNVTMAGYIPFVHMFDKKNGPFYKELFNKILINS